MAAANAGRVRPTAGGASMFEGANIGALQGGVYLNIQAGVVMQNLPPKVSEEVDMDAVIDEIVARLERLAVVLVEFRKINDDLLDKRTEHTGESFIARPQLQDWIDGKIPFLWIVGGPGTGKTYIACSIIHHSESLAEGQPDGGVAVIYAYLRYTEQLTEWDIVLALIIQLVQCSYEVPSVTATVRRLLDRHRRKKGRPSFAELVQLLKDIVKQFRDVRIVIDGLDEMLKKVQLQIIEILSDLDARIVITSRPSVLLEDNLREIKEAKGEPVTFMEFVAEDKDLDLFIHNSIGQTLTLRRLLKKHGALLRVVKAIKEKANGMFLHAALQVEMLQHCLSLREIDEALDRFPSKIEDLYAATLRRVKDGNALLPPLLLAWLLHIRGSITIDDLQFAVAVSPDTYEFEEDRMVSEADIVSACCGLIVVENTTRQARFLHYTAYEILSQLLSQSELLSHYTIARTCLARLASCGFQNSTLETLGQLRSAFSQHPLLEYAHRNSSYHIREALMSESASKSQLEQFLDDFVRRCNAYPWFPNPEPHNTDAEYLCVMFSLHVAAAFGLPTLVSDFIVKEGIDVNLRSRHPTGYGSTSLMVAGVEGHLDVLEVLLAAPAIDINLLNQWQCTVLHEPCYMGRDEVVRRLCTLPNLDVNGASYWGFPLLSASQYNRVGVVKVLLGVPRINVNQVNKDGLCALAGAALNGHPEVVELLLAVPGIDINLATKAGMTAFLFASWKGRDAIMQALLACGSLDKDKVTKSGGSPLILASQEGHVGAVRILLATSGLRVNHTTNFGDTALHAASRNGRQEVMDTLLAVPSIDVNVTNQIRQTALILAVGKGCYGIVESLLSVPGINPNLMNSNGYTPLGHASLEGHAAIARLLADTPGVDINLFEGEGEPPLSAAVSKGHEDIAIFLLTCPGIDLSIVNKFQMSALAIACWKGHTNIVKALVSVPGIDLNRRSHSGFTPLSQAASEGHVDIVRILLDMPGTDINSACNVGETPLVLACTKGHQAVIEALLNTPNIDFNLVNTQYLMSPLLTACWKGHTEAVRSLLAVPGVNLAQTNSAGFSALAHAVDSEACRLDLIRLLLNTPGIDVNQATTEGRTPLMLASIRGLADVVQDLLSVPGILLNAIDTRLDTALSHAAYHGHHDIVRALLATNKIEFDVGVSLVTMAAYGGHTDILDTFLNHPKCRIPTTKTKPGGLSVLMLILSYQLKLYHSPAAHKEDYDPQPIVLRLLEYPNGQAIANEANAEGCTPLMLAARFGYLSVVERLLEIPGVEVNATAKDGRTALKLATEHGHEAVIKKLVEGGAE